jgi:hypothetical protein
MILHTFADRPEFEKHRLVPRCFGDLNLQVIPRSETSCLEKGHSPNSIFVEHLSVCPLAPSTSLLLVVNIFEALISCMTVRVS